ncbi:MAG: uroporphyrinogen-III C-methyltransferase [Chloroflexi bacterium]|nr:MAG: uroporphyrinogen-III C-methyltransferase [Chloroflexota bacterium]
MYLIGTGPGDPNLITVKGLALLREAEAVVGDTLAHASLLQYLSPTAECFDTGSRRRGKKMPQSDICRLLVELARQGKTVVRLWPGDPFIFGRAAAEIRAAKEAGLPVQVVPGLSSALAAPAYAGIPLTGRESAAFAVVTGRESQSGAASPDWQALAGVDTLVVMMPLDDLPGLAERLIAAGRSPDTPAVVIQAGTMPHQQQVYAGLGQIAQAVDRAGLTDPALLVVGQTVQEAGQLAWFHPGDYPLLGRRVLVTRPAHQAAEFMAALRSLGAEPVAFPTIEIRPVEDTAPLDEAIRHISRYDWLVLTSANGVDAFWSRLAALGLDSRHLAAVQIAAIGPATAAALSRRSIVPDLVPEVYTAEGVLEAFDALLGDLTGRRFLLARADIARKTLTEGLLARGAAVDEFPAYRTVPVSGGQTPPPADIITFTSSSTVQGYVNCLGGRSPQEALRGAQVVCIGPITAATAKKLGLPVHAVAGEYTIEGILQTLQGLGSGD